MTFKKRIIAIVLSLVIASSVALSAVSASALSGKKWGDVDGNGKVNIIDATIIQKKLLDIPTVEVVDNYSGIADVNQDKNINIRDVTLIQMHIAGIVAELGDGWEPPIYQP